MVFPPDSTGASGAEGSFIAVAEGAAERLSRVCA